MVVPLPFVSESFVSITGVGDCTVVPFVSEPFFSIAGVGSVIDSGVDTGVGTRVAGLGEADEVDTRRKTRPPTARASPGRLDNQRWPLAARAPDESRLADPLAPALNSEQSIIAPGQPTLEFVVSVGVKSEF